MPMSKDGTWNMERHHQWIEARQKLEANRQAKEQAPLSNTGATAHNTASGPILIPARQDVLFGRGKLAREHVGNIRLRLLMESKFELYETTPRPEKPLVSGEIVQEMKHNGCRFLKQVDGMWEEVDDAVVRKKISHDFRTMRSTSNKKQQQEQRQPKVKSDSMDMDMSTGSKRLRVEAASDEAPPAMDPVTSV